MPTKPNVLKLVELGINTQREHVVFMRKDNDVSRSEGFEALNRIQITVNGKTAIATLNIITDDLLKPGEAGLSESAWTLLNAKPGDEISFAHVPPVASLGYVRAKIYRKSIKPRAFDEIIQDIVAGKYSNIELAAFITACAGDNLNNTEIIGLTKAMVKAGDTLKWRSKIVMDKHCIGGLPGNRTTPIVVSIVAAAGLTIPKTSSRAITSPAGSADTLETMTRVDLSLSRMQSVVEQENGCFVWGGGVRLSPVDDIFIRVERALDVDSTGQMIASVLSKKAAAGSTHVVIDIPVGATAKVRSAAEARKIKRQFMIVGQALGLNTKVLITDGSQPIGNGIGPSLEAMDVLKVLRNDIHAPVDLRERALLVASAILEQSGKYNPSQAKMTAEDILNNGQALSKFMAICKAQGGFQEPSAAKYRQDVVADKNGTVVSIDNRRIARVAKLAGAPTSPESGIFLEVKIHSVVRKGEPLYTIYAEHEGQLSYVLDYIKTEPGIIEIE